MIHATRLDAATASVTVISNRRDVTDWTQLYVGPWWNATTTPPAHAVDIPVLLADINPHGYEEINALVHNYRSTRQVEYAGHTLLVGRDGQDIVATSPDEQVAYRSTPASARLSLAGQETRHLAVAAARLAREVIRGQLLRAGWAVLHASAVVREDGGAVLSFGGKGAGKTTAAMLLASRGWRLLGNDRVFVRPAGDSGVQLLPWPSAAALGLGLVHTLGWDVAAQIFLLEGGSFHPTQHASVTHALLVGDHEPLWDDRGKERKVQVFPHQFPQLFDVPLATQGHAAGLLFPQIDRDSEAAPDILGSACAPGESDFMSAAEDRYPDVFDLAGGVVGGGRASVRAEVAARLATLPSKAVRLTHDTSASAALLGKIAEGF